MRCLDLHAEVLLLSYVARDYTNIRTHVCTCIHAYIHQHMNMAVPVGFMQATVCTLLIKNARENRHFQNSTYLKITVFKNHYFQKSLLSKFNIFKITIFKDDHFEQLIFSDITIFKNHHFQKSPFSKIIIQKITIIKTHHF